MSVGKIPRFFCMFIHVFGWQYSRTVTYWYSVLLKDYYIFFWDVDWLPRCNWMWLVCGLIVPNTCTTCNVRCLVIVSAISYSSIFPLPFHLATFQSGDYGVFSPGALFPSRSELFYMLHGQCGKSWCCPASRHKNETPTCLSIIPPAPTDAIKTSLYFYGQSHPGDNGICIPCFWVFSHIRIKTSW